MLSPAARSVWAKSPDDTGAWLPLWQHMDDSAHVAAKLFDDWLPRQTQELLARDFDRDIAQARTALCFLAGIHDLGKATPAFAVQCELLAQRMRDQGLFMLTKGQLLNREYAHHTVAGHRLLVEWLDTKGWDTVTSRSWAVVLGGHHGVPPTDRGIAEADPVLRPHLYGNGTWEEVRGELLERIASDSGAAPLLAEWRQRKISQQFQVIATGVVIVADWLASNPGFFPYLADPLPSPGDQRQRIDRAWAEVKLPQSWTPPAPIDDTAALYKQRFELPKTAQVRPVQRAVAEVATSSPGLGLLIIEAPMGEGKTEAALAAVEILARHRGSGGLLVALPTQATTDAMFARIVDWLDRLGAPDQSVAGALTLSHGKARLNRLYAGLMEQGSIEDVGVDQPTGSAGHAVIAHAWLSGRKKGPLANFMVGTIDQLLFAGLKARHLMLRHLGIAGKVVVIDEIHAYDAFMGSYLNKVLTWLGSYGVPVIALSATLPEQRRIELHRSYLAGRRMGEPAAAAESFEVESGYPVLTWTEESKLRSRTVEPSDRRMSVALRHLPDDLDELAELLKERLKDGGNALVVRNTVRRVLAAADRLEVEFPGEVTVAHSRFIALDRMRNDEQLLDAFGHPGRARHRPQRRVVVASQVAEQSLDVDFDLLVTDLAPVDLVLQRMGRLHRHQRGKGQAERPVRLRTAQVWVTGADFDKQPPEPYGGSRRVYGAHSLLRSAAVLAPKFDVGLELPAGIAPLVQAAYGALPIGPLEWQEAMTAAAEESQRIAQRRNFDAKTFQIQEPKKPGRAIVGWVSADVGDTDDEGQGQGQVRDGIPTLEVMLLQRDAAGQLRTPGWLESDKAGLAVPEDDEPSRHVAEIMASCTVRLPIELSNELAEETIWNKTPEMWERSRLIFRLPLLTVDESGDGELIGRQFRYTRARGLEVLRR
jgi:CRISPR-associated endonuclease/helicase Cas3